MPRPILLFCTEATIFNNEIMQKHEKCNKIIKHANMAPIIKNRRRRHPQIDGGAARRRCVRRRALNQVQQNIWKQAHRRTHTHTFTYNTFTHTHMDAEPYRHIHTYIHAYIHTYYRKYRLCENRNNSSRWHGRLTALQAWRQSHCRTDRGTQTRRQRERHTQWQTDWIEENQFLAIIFFNYTPTLEL